MLESRLAFVSCTHFIGIYSDVIDKVDKEPPFDLHAYLAPPSASTTATLNAETSSATTTTVSSTAATTTTTAATATVTSTVTPTAAANVDKPKKEPSKPKLYVLT